MYRCLPKPVSYYYVLFLTCINLLRYNKYMFLMHAIDVIIAIVLSLIYI